MNRTIATILAATTLAAANPAAAQFLIEDDEMPSVCRTSAKDYSSGEMPRDCAKKIAATKNKRGQAAAYFAWAYALNEARNPHAALPWLDKALALEPLFGNALLERAYTYNSLTEFSLGLADASLGAKTFPKIAQIYREQAYSLHYLGRFEEELAARKQAYEVGGQENQDLESQASALMWLGRYPEALAILEDVGTSGLSEHGLGLRAEAKRRMKYKPEGNEAKLCSFDSLQAISDGSIGDKEIVAACSWAFDHETDPAKRAEFLAVRGGPRSTVENDVGAHVEDEGLAAALDPGGPHNHTNFGFALMRANRNWAAVTAFNRVLAMPDVKPVFKATALAGRSNAFLAMGDVKAAKADAEASYKLDANPIAALALGQIALDEGDKPAARKYLLEAWKAGMRDDEMRERLKSLGIKDPDKEK